MWRTTSGQPVSLDLPRASLGAGADSALSAGRQYSFEPLLLPFYRTVYLYENQVRTPCPLP